jgi:hypothetical protein
VTADDAMIADGIRRELDDGLGELVRAGFEGGRIEESGAFTLGVIFEIGGRFARCPDRSVFATVEIDPGRVGWRLDATVFEYPDSEPWATTVADLGGVRTARVDDAVQHGRILAKRAWVALKDYLADCPDARDARPSRR